MHALAGVDLNLVVALHALIEECSVTSAARRVGLSQPAMSHALSRLRTHFDDPLLIRAGRKMMPTPRAITLLAAARPAVEHLETLFSPGPTDPGTFDTRIRVVTDDAIGCSVLPGILARATRQAPNLQLEVLARGTPGRKRHLRAGTADLAIGHFSSAGMDLPRQTLYAEPWVVALREGHRCATSLTLEAWAQLRHCIVSPTGGRRGRVDQLLEAQGLTRRVDVALPHFASALAFVASSDHVLTTWRSVAARAPGVVLAEPPLEMAPFDVQLMWHPRTEHDAAHRWFRELVASTLPRL